MDCFFLGVVPEVGAVFVRNAVGFGVVHDVDDRRMAANVQRANDIAWFDNGHAPIESGACRDNGLLYVLQAWRTARCGVNRGILDVIDFHTATAACHCN